MQDTQLPTPSPPHATITPAKIIKIKNFIDTSGQNINPLTIENLAKNLDQSTQAARLCSSPILVSVDELQKVVVKSKEVKVKTQEPPLITQTTGILFLPPPSPPKVVTDALQVPSAVAVGEDKEKLVQLASTPPTIDSEKEKQIEEKEETRDEEESTIQTLVELPKIGTPTQTLQKSSIEMLALQVRTLGSSSTRVARTIHYGILELHEEIKIPYYESNNLTKEKINEIQCALDRRRRQEALRKDYKYRQALNEIKDKFMDAFSLQSLNESRPIIEQLSDIVDQVTNEDHDTNAKLMEWP